MDNTVEVGHQVVTRVDRDLLQLILEFKGLVDLPMENFSALYHSALQESLGQQSYLTDDQRLVWRGNSHILREDLAVIHWELFD